MTEAKEPPVRVAVNRDMPFILSSWTKASHSHLSSELFLAKRGSPPPLGLYKHLFQAHQDRIIKRSTVLVACDDDDPSTILGYLIFEQPTKDTPAPVLHYLQVKRDLMRKGVASTLLRVAEIHRAGQCFYTFTSPIQGKVKTPHNWFYVPYYLMEKA